MIKKYLRQLLLLFTLFLLSSFSLAYQQSDSSESAFQQGHFEQAVQSLKATLIKLTPNSEAYIDTAVRLAIAYQTLGHFKTARNILRTTEKMAQKINDPMRHAIVLNHLSDIHLALSRASTNQACSISSSENKTAVECINRALEKARQSNDSLLIANTFNRQGNLFIVQQQYDDALNAYYDALQKAQVANDKVLIAKIRLNIAQMIGRYRATQKIDYHAFKQRFKSVLSFFKTTLDHIHQLSSSHNKAFALIGITKAMRDFQKEPVPKKTSATVTLYPTDTDEEKSRTTLSPFSLEIQENIFGPSSTFWPPLKTGEKNQLTQWSINALMQADNIAKALNNERAISYAKGYLAEFYEQQQRYPEAEQLTRQAIFLAQRHSELLYRWEGQLGRLFEKQGQFHHAMNAYQQAISSTEQAKIRQELQAGYRVYHTFREVMSPIYLGLANLLLKKAYQSHGQEQQELLKKARNQLEIFKEFELRDYFKEECMNQLKETREKYDDNQLPKNTALLYPVLFEDRIELLLSVGHKIHQFILSENKETLEEQIIEFRQELTNRTQTVTSPAKKLYQWLIQPVADILDNHDITHILIVPEGLLRTIPFTALYDGNEYLVNNYAITIMPKLQIPTQTPLHKTKILLGGLSKKPQHADFQTKNYEFSALKYVDSELEELKTMLNVPATNQLQNDEFTFIQLKKKVFTEEFNIIHLATHGHFDGKPNETFLVASDGKITIKKLRQLVSPAKFRETPIELLTLSACQTALGDEQAALGLAGIALSSGVRSALASLWKVNDRSTAQLMTLFYHNLSKKQSKAHALQNAQRQLRQNLDNPKYAHPYYWAAFLLIEN